MTITISIIIVPILAFTTPATAEPLRVIDGDTIDLAGQRIRLWGIDAPERSQTCDGRDGHLQLLKKHVYLGARTRCPAYVSRIWKAKEQLGRTG